MRQQRIRLLAVATIVLVAVWAIPVAAPTPEASAFPDFAQSTGLEAAVSRAWVADIDPEFEASPGFEFTAFGNVFTYLGGMVVQFETGEYAVG